MAPTTQSKKVSVSPCVIVHHPALSGDLVARVKPPEFYASVSRCSSNDIVRGLPESLMSMCPCRPPLRPLCLSQERLVARQELQAAS